MYRGGYKIVDLQDKSITEEGVTIAGIHATIEGSHRKALCLGNVVLDGVEKNDAFVSFAVSEGSYITEVYGVKLEITDEDVVKIVAE